MVTEEAIKRAAKLGARFSEYCRDPFTKEKTRGSVRLVFFGGPHMMEDFSWLEWLGLISLEICADLEQVRLGKPDQHIWKAPRWEREIRKRL
jgi:hypothetical protein